MIARAKPRVFLFLQGPISPFFSDLAVALEAAGHRTLRVNLWLGDRLFWRRPGAIDYRGRLADWPDWIAALMRRHCVTDLILLGEQRSHHHLACEVAHELDVAVTVTDFGYLRPDWITLEPDGMSGRSRFPRDPARIRALAAGAPPVDLQVRHGDSFRNQAVWDVGYHLAGWLGWPLYPHYRSHQLYHPLANYAGTGWRLLRRPAADRAARAHLDRLWASGQPYWVLPMQMDADFAIRAYSRFAGMEDAIGVVVRSFARHAPAGHELVIKLHPLDPGLRPWRRLIGRLAAAAGVADRVSLIDGGPLDALLQRSQGCVTVNSTVGLWAVRHGRPTLTLGAAVYDVPGITVPGGEAALDRFWSNPPAPDADLLDAFIRALALTIQVRGVFYRAAGRRAAVAAALDWFDRQALAGETRRERRRA